MKAHFIVPRSSPGGVALPLDLIYNQPMDGPATLEEQPATYGIPVPEEVLGMAREAVKSFHECFWWWHPDATVTTREDVRAVVECLRESGGHRAWSMAQKIYKCL